MGEQTSFELAERCETRRGMPADTARGKVFSRRHPSRLGVIEPAASGVRAAAGLLRAAGAELMGADAGLMAADSVRRRSTRRAQSGGTDGWTAGAGGPARRPPQRSYHD